MRLLADNAWFSSGRLCAEAALSETGGGKLAIIRLPIDNNLSIVLVGGVARLATMFLSLRWAAATKPGWWWLRTDEM